MTHARPRRTRRIRPFVVCVLVAASLLPILWLVNARTPRPSGLGPSDGLLAPCPNSPNCVNSQSDPDRSRVEPMAFAGPQDAVIPRLKAMLTRIPRVTLVQENPGYLHYEFRTALFRFVDDVEFLVDGPAGVIHVRSASRLGYSDFGTNRRRVEAIRAMWQAENPIP